MWRLVQRYFSAAGFYRSRHLKLLYKNFQTIPRLAEASHDLQAVARGLTSWQVSKLLTLVHEPTSVNKLANVLIVYFLIVFVFKILDYPD